MLKMRRNTRLSVGDIKQLFVNATPGHRPDRVALFAVRQGAEFAVNTVNSTVIHRDCLTLGARTNTDFLQRRPAAIRQRDID